MCNGESGLSRNKAMPAKSEKQRKFMGMCAHGKGQARGKCPSKKVAEEFSRKPKGGYKRRSMPKKDANGYY